MSSGDTSTTPSVYCNPGEPWMRRAYHAVVTPRSLAICAMFFTPTSRAICAYTVLTDCAVACWIVRDPPPSPSALWIVQSAPVQFGCVYAVGAAYTFVGGNP